MKTKKEKIKTIAIVFLSIMLVLTFFSNTIMNYSLVEVQTQMAYGDTLITKVRGTGTVEAADLYKVSLKESRTIATINVRTGAQVSTGDVLFTLDSSESTELSTARDDLATAEQGYATEILAAGITVAEREEIENNQIDLSDCQNKLQSAQAVVDAATDNVNALTKKKAKESGTDVAQADISAETTAYAEAKKNLAAAELDKGTKDAAYEKAKAEYDALYAQVNGTDVVATNDKLVTQQQADALAEAKKKMDNAYDAQSDALDTYNQLKLIADTANDDLTEAREGQTDTSGTAKSQTDVDLELANADLTIATDDLKELSEKLSAKVKLASEYQSLLSKREKVANMEGNANGSEITSPIAGTIAEITLTAGQTTTADEPVITIQPENKGYTLSFTVTSNQAKRIKVGDPADILYNYWGTDMSAKVTSMHRDAQDKDKMVVVCEVSGTVSIGDSLTVSIGSQAAYYDIVIPTSAIREEDGKKIIYYIESKSTPLGNRYYARKMEVEVIASDDTNSAVTGTFSGGEYVITTTTKPVKDGQQVRLAETIE